MTSGPDELNGPARWWDETGDYELRQILHWRWDPIGVANVFPYAADEYGNYAPTIVDALRAGRRPPTSLTYSPPSKTTASLTGLLLPLKSPSTACASWARPSSAGTKPPNGGGPNSGRFLGSRQV